MKKNSLLAICSFILLFTACFFSSSAFAYNEQGFDKFIRQTKALARSKGISNKTIEAAFSHAKFDHAIVLQDVRQPERSANKAGFQKYKSRVVSETRISNARKNLDENYELLDKIEKTYGVEKEILVALWGVETNFGTYCGDFNLISAFTSLAYEGRRRDFFLNELMNALKIVDEGHIDVANFKGSWAGAFGQVQFMPSTFLKHAVDFDGDGRKDLWTNKADALASAANYLRNLGWNSGMGWGKRVKLTKYISKKYLTRKYTTSIYKWRQSGVKFYSGGSLPISQSNASVIDPDGNEVGNFKEVYIVYDNFKRIMEWNRSTYFATSIGLIADSIKR